MTPEYIIGTILVGGITAVFALYQKGVADQMKSKDGEILWLRSQLEPLLDATRTAVQAAERIYATPPPKP